MVDKKHVEDNRKNVCNNDHHRTNGVGGAVYGLGLIGSAIYYLQHATTFGLGVFGIFKAIVWPALLIYRLFALLKL